MTSSASMRRDAESDECPDAGVFALLASGRLDASTHEAVDRHVDACSSCFELLAALVNQDEQPTSTDDVRPLQAGDRAGRYIVRHLVGRGGMGLVYAAFDPVLRRTVALKLIRSADGAAIDTARRTLLLHEAQTLARLSHPNVVPIHDVGVIGGRPWVVMELVEGVTLRAWMAQHADAPWSAKRAILEACLRGLAAAHGAGVVHRDFKPDNVMIGGDGRVRIMDFGLAHVMAEPTGGRDDAGRTQFGAVGTPAYMAPEQIGGGHVDARADQFAFAVTAYELLWGTRPYAGDDLEAIARSVATHRRRLPARRGVPRRVVRALGRALAAEPDERWPDLDRLVAVIGRERGGLHRATAVTAFVATAIAAVLVADHLVDRHARAACIEASTGALADAPRPHDPGLAATTDAWMQAWAEADQTACLAALQPRSDVHDTRGCLHEAAASFRSTMEVLADDVEHPRARELVDELPDPTACGSTASSTPARDAATSAAIVEIREQLAHARVLQTAGLDRDALEVATGALGQARAQGDDPTLARALRLVGTLQERVGDFEAAEAASTEAYWIAGRSGADDVAALAAADVAQLVAAHDTRPEESEVWTRHAAMMLDRQTAARPEDRAAVRAAIATVAWSRGDYDAALQGFAMARAVLVDADGEDAAAVATMDANMGVMLYELGRVDEALVHLDHAIAVHTATYGADHPDVARDRLMRANTLLVARRGEDALREAQAADAIAARSIGDDHPDRIAYYTGVGAAAHAVGDLDLALRWHGQALALQQRSSGPDHPDAGIALENLGGVLDQAGRHAEAIEHFRRSLAIFRHAYGDAHDRVGSALHDLALAEHGAKRDGEAIVHYREALAVWERSLGEHHLTLGRGRVNLANALLAHGEHDAAFAEYRRAITILEQAAGIDHPITAIAWTSLGVALQEHGHDAEAIAPLARALALREHGPDHERVAAIRRALASALSSAMRRP